MDDKSLAQVIDELISYKISKINVQLPGKVTKYDADNQRANVLIMTKEYNELDGDDSDTNQYILPDVPVEFLAGGDDAFIKVPVNEGTLGAISFYNIDIGSYLAGSGRAPVNSTGNDRRFDLSDCSFRPGLRPFARAVSAQGNDAIEIKHGDMAVNVYGDGTIEIKNSAGNELVTIVSAIASILSGTNTDIATYMSVAATSFGTIATAFGALNTDAGLSDSTKSAASSAATASTAMATAAGVAQTGAAAKSTSADVEKAKTDTMKR